MQVKEQSCSDFLSHRWRLGAGQTVLSVVRDGIWYKSCPHDRGEPLAGCFVGTKGLLEMTEIMNIEVRSKIEKETKNNPNVPRLTRKRESKHELALF